MHVLSFLLTEDQLDDYELQSRGAVSHEGTTHANINASTGSGTHSAVRKALAGEQKAEHNSQESDMIRLWS